MEGVGLAPFAGLPFLLGDAGVLIPASLAAPCFQCLKGIGRTRLNALGTTNVDTTSACHRGRLVAGIALFPFQSKYRNGLCVLLQGC